MTSHKKKVRRVVPKTAQDKVRMEPPKTTPIVHGSSEDKTWLLRVHLQTAVPLWVLAMKNWSSERIGRVAEQCCDTVASEGDNILYKSRVAGKSAQAFNALAQGIAVLSMQPGGVMVFGHHFCTDHSACQHVQVEMEVRDFVQGLRDLADKFLH